MSDMEELIARAKDWADKNKFNDNPFPSLLVLRLAMALEAATRKS